MRCVNCGNRIKDDFEFCPKCGTKVIRELVCQKCGTVNDPDSLFCKKCGSALNEHVKTEEKPVNEPLREPQKPAIHTKSVSKGKFINSIIASSLSLCAMILIFSFLFVPFISDGFLPTGEYTIIYHLKQVFGTGIRNLANNNQIATIFNVFAILVLFVASGIFTLVMIGLSIPKLVKGIMQRKFFNLSGKMMQCFTLFLVTFVYFIGFIQSEELYYSDSISGWIIFLVIFVCLAAIYNLFYVEVFENKSNIGRAIFRLITMSLFLGLLMATTLLIGGSKFAFSIIYETKQNSSILNNVTLVDEILKYTNYLTINSIDILTIVFVFSLISFILELCALSLSASLAGRLVTNKKNFYRTGMIIVSIIFGFFVVSMIFDIIAASTLNRVDSLAYYGAMVTCRKIIGQSIAKIIVCGITLAGFITLFVLNKKGVIKK